MLARPVLARLTQPPADVSAMDGYAVRAADARAGRRAARGRQRAGGTSLRGRGRSRRGGAHLHRRASCPAGADAILLQEDAEAADGRVRVGETVRAGRWIRRRGLDFETGETAAARRAGA